MRLAPPQRNGIRRISLTPLIDIVFILLLFFILESNFLRFGELVFNSPEQEEPGRSPVEVLELEVYSDGRIWLEGRSLQTETLDDFLADNGYAKSTPVFVRAQDELPLQELVRVVDILQGRGLTQLQILALENQ
ncbi:MAG: biopolymer transporter ExbD [Pseudomonadota bacterium]